MNLSAGSKSQTIGLYKMALGACADAVDDFETAAEWYFEGARETRRRHDSLSNDFEGGVTLLEYLYSTILAGDDERLEQAMDVARETDESHYHQFSTTVRYHLMNALVAILDDTSEHRAHLEELETEMQDLPDDHERYFGALKTALEGIVDRDSAAFHTGVERFLEWHDEENVELENRTSADDLVCFEVVTLIVLARREGMDVHVSSPYVPECIYQMTGAA